MSLHSVLERYELRRQQLQNTHITCVFDDEFHGKVSLPEKLVEDPFFRNENKKKNRIKVTSESIEVPKYRLNGTGRMAFGPESEVGEIYRYIGQGFTSSPMIDDLEEIRLNEMNLNDSVRHVDVNPSLSTKTDTSSNSNPRKTKNQESKEENNKSNKKQNTSNHPVSLASPLPSQSNSTTSQPQSSHKPSSSSDGKKSAPNPYFNSRTNRVGVGQVTGKAAAMARMAALGETWAEEEELPGFNLPSSNSLNGIGQPNKQVAKEVNKELQRQKKVIGKKK